MKKTINVNIGRSAFVLDEDAYNALQSYLNSIERCFSDSDGRKEIMEDIELRIAELLSQRVKGQNLVIANSDIDHIMGVMGKPEDYTSGVDNEHSKEEDQKKTVDSNFNDFSGDKRLYRDSDNQVIAGVCSGFAHYVGVDVIWIRILLLVGVFFAGFPVILYIILWVIVPKAETTPEKLKMKGERVDFSTIAKTVEEEVANAAKSVSGAVRKKNFSHIGDQIVEVLNWFLRAFKGFFGVIFLLVGFSLFIPLFISLVGEEIMMSWNGVGFNESFAPLLFNSSASARTFHWGMILMLVSLSVLFLSLGFRWLLRLSKNLRWVSLVALLSFIASIVMVSTSSASLASDFKSKSVYEGKGEFIELNSDTLKLSSFSSEIVEGEHLIKGEFFAKRDFESINIGYPVLKVTEDSLLKNVNIQIIKESRGASSSIAMDKCKSIHYEYHINGNELILDPAYSIQFPYRVQRLTVNIKVPVGTIIVKDEYIPFFRNQHFFDELIIDEDFNNYGITTTGNNISVNLVP